MYLPSEIYYLCLNHVNTINFSKLRILSKNYYDYYKKEQVWKSYLDCSYIEKEYNDFIETEHTKDFITKFIRIINKNQIEFHMIENSKDYIYITSTKINKKLIHDILVNNVLTNGDHEYALQIEVLNFIDDITYKNGNYKDINYDPALYYYCNILAFNIKHRNCMYINKYKYSNNIYDLDKFSFDIHINYMCHIIKIKSQIDYEIYNDYEEDNIILDLPFDQELEDKFNEYTEIINPFKNINCST